MAKIYEGNPQPQTAFERIMGVHVPLWAKRFELKSRDYNSGSTGWEPHTFLGVRGQFADIWRKIGKLKKSLWDGEALQGEQPVEIIDDLIAHLFLTRDLLVRELPEPGTPKPKPEGEGAERLGLSHAEWVNLTGLADRVIRGEAPELLESRGFMIVTMTMNECRDWMCTNEKETARHSYEKQCHYRLRPRRSVL